MTTFDFSPLYRTVVGFDRLAHLVDTAMRYNTAAESYPPYNIEKLGEDAYRITLAVAGFSEAELAIEVEGNTLTVSGKRGGGNSERAYLYKGIAGRDFVRKFELADYVEVTGAGLVNGLLTIDLARVIPEAMKPRAIEIKASAPTAVADAATKVLSDGSEKKAA